MARKYEMKRRARRQEETRRRITEAAVELHQALGPANTTISAIAERARVQRLTVYKKNWSGANSPGFFSCPYSPRCREGLLAEKKNQVQYPKNVSFWYSSPPLQT